MKAGAKKVLLLVMIFTVAIGMTGCKALMEQENVDPTKTVGEPVYTGFDDIDKEGEDEQVVKGGGMVCDMAKVTWGQNNWKKFMKKVEEGKECSIRIKQKAGDAKAYYRDLMFDGKKYRLVISTDPEKYDYTYDNLYDLSGRRNKYCRKSRIVFLSNTKDASFEDIIGSIGVNDQDQKIDYQLVFRNQ